MDTNNELSKAITREIAICNNCLDKDNSEIQAPHKCRLCGHSMCDTHSYSIQLGGVVVQDFDNGELFYMHDIVCETCMKKITKNDPPDFRKNTVKEKLFDTYIDYLKETIKIYEDYLAITKKKKKVEETSKKPTVAVTSKVKTVSNSTLDKDKLTPFK